MCLCGQVLGTGATLLHPFVNCIAFIFYMLTFVVHIILACVCACLVGQEGWWGAHVRGPISPVS